MTDSSASPYFFEYLSDCTSLYETLKKTLPKEKFDKLTPVYMSEREYKKLITEFRRSKGYDLSDTPVDYSDYSDEANWLRLPDVIKKVDTFYLYPAAYNDGSEGARLLMTS